MAVITKIEDQKNKKRFNIFVDDAFFCGLNKETAIVFGLKVGKEIETSQLELAVFESEVKSAFEKSIDYISSRMNTKKELYDKLIKKGYAKDVVLKAIEKLVSYHYVDDEAFAKQFVAQNQKYSKRIVENKLRQKGVDKSIIEKFVSEESENKEYQLCEAQAKKYLNGKDVTSENFKQKMFASLARKGFDYDVIKSVCGKVLNSNDFEDYEND